MNITVYTREDCGACYHTKRWLDYHHVPYTEIALTDDDTDVLVEKGFTTLPVVVTSDGFAWEGFRMDKLKALSR
jgi:glutaredoxin-like protein NrdH